MNDVPDTRFLYRNPAHRLVFGRNALDKLPEVLSTLGVRKPMLVCSARGAASAAALQIVQSLGIAPDAVFSGVHTHAPLASVDQAWKQALALQPDCLVALGGGSASDTAKGIALACAEQGRVLDFVLERGADGQLKGRDSSAPKLPIVAVPTTVSGAEVSPSFGLTDDSGRKLIIRHDSLAPCVLIYDPDLLRSVPLATLAPSVMNALAHDVEALYSKGRNPISAMYACASVPLLHGGLSVALDDAGNSDAYAGLALGAYYAAMAIVNARTGLHHAICHKLAPAAGLSHGTANTIVLPRALEFNLPEARPELLQVARLLCREARARDELRAEDAIAQLVSLSQRAGLPQRLRDVGVSEALFPSLAEKIVTEPGLAFNPRQVRSAREIEDILRASW